MPHCVQGTFPQAEDAAGDRVAAPLVREVGRLGKVLALDIERARLAAVGQPYPAAPGQVVADFLIALIGFSRVRSLMTMPASIMRSTRSVAPTLSSVRGLAHVGVAPR